MRTCKVCRDRYEARAPMQVVCSPPCGIAYAQAQRVKKTKKEEAADRKATKEKLQALRTKSDYLKDAQKAFNEFIRWRDRIAGHPCISSGERLDWGSNEVDAGHYRSTGAAKHLRFNEDNCHAQAKRENRYLAGNAVAYRVNLIARIGLERVEALENDNTQRKWSIDDLKAICATYRAKTRELKKQL